MRVIVLLLLAAGCAAGGGASANAAGDPHAASGLIADRCASCHEVPGYEARWERADVNAPSFEAIARNPDVYTPARVRAFLQKPHWPMTQFILSASDIDNILAFIAELR
jgi:cytochrome c553